MKRNKVLEYTKRLTPRQLALAELETEEAVDDRCSSPDELITNHLIPRRHAKKRKIILYKGKIVDVCEVPDHKTRLKALRTAFELAGALPAKGTARKRREHEGIQVIVAPPADGANKPLEPQPPLPETSPPEAPKIAPNPTPGDEGTY